MSADRRAILLGLLGEEFVRALGDRVAEAALAAVPNGRIVCGALGELPIFNLRVRHERAEIDVTSYGDDARRFVPGLQRMFVEFEIDERALRTAADSRWIDVLRMDVPARIVEQVGDMQLDAAIRVSRIYEMTPINGTRSVHVSAVVVGRPTFEPVDGAPPLAAAAVAAAGRRAMRLPGGSDEE